MNRRCQVFFVGAGPGDPELLTLKAKRIIEEADLVLCEGRTVTSWRDRFWKSVLSPILALPSDTNLAERGCRFVDRGDCR